MCIYEDNGNKGLTDIFKQTYCPQATGVLEATIKGTTSSFMKVGEKQHTQKSLRKSQEHSSIIPREYSESFKVQKST